MAKRSNHKYITKLVSQSDSYKNQIADLVREKVQKSKALMVAEFNEHPVTREVEDGPNSENISRTLPSGYGNLYTFIGFRYGSDPTNAVRSLLSLTKVLNQMKSRASGNNKIITTFTVSTPSEDQIKSVSKMPWEGGKSWVYGVERGISGFSHYVYKNYVLSRSTKGLQSKHKALKGSFKPMYDGYITKILKNFFDRISR